VFKKQASKMFIRHWIFFWSRASYSAVLLQ